MRTTRTWMTAFAYAGLAAACAGPADVGDAAVVTVPTPTITVGEPPTTEITSTAPTDSVPASTSTVNDGPPPAGGPNARVDLSDTGNRWIEGRGSLTSTSPVVIDVGDAAARWILPTGTGGWVVVLDDGATVDVFFDGDVARATAGRDAGSIDVDIAPPILMRGTLVAQAEALDAFPDPLPDTRTVTDGERVFALGGPSDRYGHGVLGDAIEGTSLDVINADGSIETIVELADPDVFEAVSPMLADLDGDGDLEIAMTVANGATGARIVVYETDGAVHAETPPIGRGNRWRNLLAVAPTGPNGEIELIDVQTPHIGGILQFFRDDGAGNLVRAAATPTYSTHSIGSRNLDLGIVTDADGDGQLDVVLPTQDQSSLAIVTRDASTESGTREVAVIELGARISTNVAAHADSGVVDYAVGLEDGRVLIWLASP